MKDNHCICPPERPIPATSLSTATFRWRHQEGWEGDHFHYYESNRALLPQVVFAPPATAYPPRNNRQPPVPQSARWVFQKLHGDTPANPSGWGDIQVFFKRFTSALIFVGGKTFEQKPDEAACEALSFLISGSMLLVKPDIVRLFFATSKDITSFEERRWGEMRTVITPMRDQFTFHSMPSLLIDPATWWTLPDGQRDRRILSYLDRRMAPPPAKSRRFSGGLIRQILRPRID